MTLSSMIVSGDWQEVSVFECILGSLRMDVDVESELRLARIRLQKTKIDAVIVDRDLNGADELLQELDKADDKMGPVVIVSGSNVRSKLETAGASFVVEKPVSVEQAVHTLSAARNMILKGRLRYHREELGDVPVSLVSQAKDEVAANLLNLSQGGLRVHLEKPTPLSGKIGINFCLPGTHFAMEARGEVAWTDKQGNAGIRLVEISEPMKRNLQLWLERQFFGPTAVS